jgi:hypothetical protein
MAPLLLLPLPLPPQHLMLRPAPNPPHFRRLLALPPAFPAMALASSSRTA